MDCMNMLPAPFCSLHTLNQAAAAAANRTLSNPWVISDAFKFYHHPQADGWKKKKKEGKKEKPTAQHQWDKELFEVHERDMKS